MRPTHSHSLPNTARRSKAKKAGSVYTAGGRPTASLTSPVERSNSSSGIGHDPTAEFGTFEWVIAVS